MVQQPASKEQAEEHYQTTDQIGYSSIFEDDANEETDGSSRKIEKNKNQHEFEEGSPIRLESDHWIDDDTHDNGWYESQWYNVENHLGREIGDWSIVSVRSLSHKKQSLGGEDSQACQGTKTEER